MKKTTPLVTVLMSVYNSEKFLVPAIDSILTQTFEDFEFLIINDGSTDHSLEIIRKYMKQDGRIRLINRENKGLTYSLNEGIHEARGKYIARMDSDDISTPDRLAIEVEYLKSNPEVALVGSNYTIIDEETSEPKVTTNIFTHPDDLKVAQVISNQYGHGSILMKAEVMREMGGYDPKVGHVEDYDLWTRTSRKYPIANIRKPLYLYRSVSTGVTLSKHEEQIRLAFGVRDKAFEHFLTNRDQYRLFAWRPGTCDDYAKKKAMMYRGYALMYRKTGHRIKAMCMLIVSFFLDRRHPKTVTYMKHTINNRPLELWEFEFL